MLADIVQHLSQTNQSSTNPHQWPDQKNGYWALCPYHADTHIGSFSFHPQHGFHCFSCGASGSLVDLAKHLGLDSRPDNLPATLTLYPPPKRPVAPPWTLYDPEKEYRPLGPLCRDYAHRRGLSDASIDRWQIGDGMVPGPCPHYRMILPIYQEGKLVDLRGRAYETADEYPKWLGAKGSHAALDGWDDLEQARGKVVVLVEAPLSRRLIMQEEPNWVAVAGTCGAGTWRSIWTEALVRARPLGVLIWLDNDLAGCPNQEAYRDGLIRHLQKSPEKPVPVPNGKKRLLEFQQAGLSCQIYPWAKGSTYGADPSDVVMKNVG